MQTKIIGALIVLALIGGAFWVGTSYGASNVSAANVARSGQFGVGNFGGGASGVGSAGGSTRAGRSGTGGGFATGQIVTSDANSITIKLATGSTQIILIGTSTQVLKSTLGQTSDLSSGTDVTITGSANSDGSLTAQSIQIRPAGMDGFGGRAPAATPAQ